MTLRVHHQIVLLPKFLVGQFDRITRVVDNSRVAEVDSANMPIALDAARVVFNLDRNNLAASLLPELCKGETFKVMLGDAILGHHSTPIEPALRSNGPKTLLNRFRSFAGHRTVGARLGGVTSRLRPKIILFTQPITRRADCALDDFHISALPSERMDRPVHARRLNFDFNRGDEFAAGKASDFLQRKALQLVPANEASGHVAAPIAFAIKNEILKILFQRKCDIASGVTA